MVRYLGINIIIAIHWLAVVIFFSSYQGKFTNL
jgi:hypothetical protein